MAVRAPQLDDAKEQARLQVIRDLGLSSDLFEAAYDRVIRMTRRLAGVPICAFSVVEADRQFLKAREGIAFREAPRSIAFCAWAIAQDDLSVPVIVENAAEHPDYKDNPLVTGEPGIRFYAGIPVLAPNQLPVGTVCVIDTKPREFDQEISQALHDAKALLEDALILQARAIRDPLTGLYNRSYLAEGLDREWLRGYRHLLPLSLLMIDVDRFADYNAHYDEARGDEVLMNVATVVQSKASRAGDVAVRYGGDQFVLFLPETDKVGCAELCEDLVQSVRNLHIAHTRSDRGIITVSVGAVIASAHEHLNAGSDRLMNLAEGALYAAKAKGRNQSQLRELPVSSQRDDLAAQRKLDRPRLAKG